MYFCRLYNSLIHIHMGAIKWIGGVLGWSVGGIIGAILGFSLGAVFDNAFSGDYAVDDPYKKNASRSDNWKRQQTQPGDFGVSLLVLSAAVMKSDKEVVKSELDFVKHFFKMQFGQEKAEGYILTLRDLLKQDYDIMAVCMQIRTYMDFSSRLQLMHYLYGLSTSDGSANASEIDIIRSIGNYLGISAVDLDSIQSMFIKDNESAYKVLEISSDVTDEEVKKAYKKMAMKYHPDKVSHLGEDVQKAANEKFKEVNLAYERITKERGMN